MFPEFSSLGGFVLWLASAPGALLAVGFFVSYVLERFDWWHKVAHDLKSVLVVGLAIGVAFVSKNYLSVELVVDNPDLNWLFSMLVYYFGNQVGYKKYFDNNPS